MKIKQAEFVKSSQKASECPPPKKAEYAFIGRSNVGKSSLINMLTGRKSLAKTSGRPGKTQLINHFIINDAWFLVDLPGYGWAKVSKTEKQKWEKMIQNYFLTRENLCCTFLLIDSRVPPQKIDLEFLQWLGSKGMPVSLVFTKADKQSPNKTDSAVAAFKKEMKKDWDYLPDIFVTSSEKKMGKEEILEFISEINASFQV